MIEKGWSFKCLVQYGVSETQGAHIPHEAALSTSKSESKTSNDPQSMQTVQEWSAKKLFMSNLVVCGR